MLATLVFVSTLFVPGFFVVDFLSEKFRLNMDVIEKIVFGSLLWNYSLVVPSILLGLSTRLITSYFSVFSIISAVTIVFFGIRMLRAKRILKFRLQIAHYSSFIAIVLGLLLLILCLICILFHSIYLEWDAITTYIPATKAMLLDKGFAYNSYRLLGFPDASPTIPILWGYSADLSDIASLYILTAVFFVLTLLTMFLIARKVFPRDVALASLPMFIALPVTVLTLSARSLYLDIPFLSYLLATLYAVVRIVGLRESGIKSTWLEYGMFTIGGVLMFFTRVEFALPLISILVVLFVLTYKPKYWEIISAGAIFIFSMISDGFRELRKIDAGLFVLSDFLPWFLLILTMSLLIFFLLRATSRQYEGRGLVSGRCFVLILAIASPAIIFLLTNVMIHGFVVPGWALWNGDMLSSNRILNTLTPTTLANPTEILRFDRLLWIWWLAPVFLVPVIFSICTFAIGFMKRTKPRVRKASTTAMAILIVFIGLLLLWSQLYCDPQPRRLFYFAPFVALVAAYGASRVKKLFGLSGFGLRVCAYATVITGFFLMRLGAQTANDISLMYANLYEPTAADAVLIIFSSVAFLLIFFPYEASFKKIQANLKNLNLIKTSAVLLAACAIIGFFLIPMAPIVSNVLSEGDQTRYKYDRERWWLQYPDVVDYYNKNVTTDGVTIGFYCSDLITFANRSVIDLSDPVYGMPIYSVLNTSNETLVANTLKELNCKYFLKPKSNNPYYDLYEKLVNSTILGKILSVDNPSLRFIADFDYVTLYELFDKYTATPIVYSDITPWNYNPAENYTLTVQANFTQFSGTTDEVGRLRVMFSLNPPIGLEDALWVALKSHNKSELNVILFTNLQDRTTDYFTYQCQLPNETANLVVSIKEGYIKGNFNPSHVEGILIGLRTEQKSLEAFDLSEIYLIEYELPY